MEQSRYYPAWLNRAISQLGTKEIPGRKHNPQIVEYHKTTEGAETQDEVSWCSSFVNWCFDKESIQGTNSKLARSWIRWGQSIPIAIPALGCVAVFRRGNSSWQGHVGFYLRHDKLNVYILGGNQSNKVSVIAYPKNKLLGYRWPG